MPRPPRVAFVNGGILGLTSYARWLRATLTPDDADAVHIVLSEDLSLADRVRRRLVCQRLWFDPPGLANLDLARFRQEWHAGLLARRRLAAHGPGSFDVLHFHRQATAYASLDLMARTPAIVSIDCSQVESLGAARSAIERASLAPNVRRDGRIFSAAAAIVATSAWAARGLRRLYPACETPVTVLAPPVDLAFFDEAWPGERAARAAAGGLPRFLFVGGDFPRKGGYDLLEAWTRGGFAGRAELVLVTDWPIGALPPGVTQAAGITGHTEPWARAWREADVFVLPTRREAYGLAFQEAGAAGLPVIGARVNAVPEIIEDGTTGMLVPPGDIAALITAMDALVESPALRDRLGRAARQRIAALADPVEHKARLLELIRTAAARGRTPS
jgi:glycosyltransferase involved in cell wall biosynthesis